MHACVIWIINFNTSFAAAGANSWFAGDHCPHVALLLLMSGLGTMRGFIPANTSRCRDAATVLHHQTPSPAVHRCLADIKAMFDNTNTRRKCLLQSPLPPCRNSMLLNTKLLGTTLHYTHFAFEFQYWCGYTKTLLLKILYNIIKYRLTVLTCLLPGSALAPGQLWLLVTWHQNKSMNEFNKGRKRAIKLHGCGGAVEQVSFNFYICILRFCAVMSLRQSACYWSYYALPDSLSMLTVPVGNIRSSTSDST